MILIIDNYDSFTYNLYQYIGEIDREIEVYRNDRLSVEEIAQKKPSHIVISPGPGFPKDAGISIEAVRKLGKHIPVLGVCLGHQAVGEAYGGKVVHAKRLMHGKVSEIQLLDGCRLFDSLPRRIKAGRYHSLVVTDEGLSQEMRVTARSDEGEIMGLMHVKYPVFGIQFHPESIMTPHGKEILKNFLKT